MIGVECRKAFKDLNSILRSPICIPVEMIIHVVKITTFFFNVILIFF